MINGYDTTWNSQKTSHSSPMGVSYGHDVTAVYIEDWHPKLTDWAACQVGASGRD